MTLFIYMMKALVRISMIVCCSLFSLEGQEIHVRFNQVGYQPGDQKIFLIMADQDLDENPIVQNEEGKYISKDSPFRRITHGLWGKYDYQYSLDLSLLEAIGVYRILHNDKILCSFEIISKPYAPYQPDLLSFMRQQRCGYNPYFDMVCHQRDGKLFYGPVPDSAFYDFTGGWHDAGDQLKYLITGSNATARLLMAYQMAHDSFVDEVDALGHSHAFDR